MVGPPTGLSEGGRRLAENHTGTADIILGIQILCSTRVTVSIIVLEDEVPWRIGMLGNQMAKTGRVMYSGGYIKHVLMCVL